MSRYELTISPTYVSDWGLREGIREFVQNAVDQETLSGGLNKFTWSYSAENNCLEINSMNSVLEPKSLLLGATTKANQPDAIGQFGEGYKLGTLACIRSEHPVIFKNRGAKENWMPHFVKSRRYNSTILVFDIEHTTLIARTGAPSLTIQISNISMTEWHELIESILQFQPTYNELKTDKGSILLDEQHKSKVFVNGLFVNTLPRLFYGYNIPAKYLKLGRDRNIVPEFDTKWATSEIWKLANSNLVLDLIDNTDWDDAAYVTSFGTYSIDKSVKDAAYNKFTTRYGADTIPVKSQSELEAATAKGQHAVVVSESYCNMVKAADSYVEPVVETPTKLTVAERLRAWYEGIRNDSEIDLTEQQMDDFEDIISELEVPFK
jgi:hypothetical protein